MPNANFVILYVDSPRVSAGFYRDLLAREPVEASATFALFALDSGLLLGLWSRHTVEPVPTGSSGGAEVAFTLDNAAAVDATCAGWRGRGLTIVQQPADMDFGRTFVAVDPDGHRLRVFAPVSQ
jgi:catechol 2,3-dioxygenase-like lactoylglutathione lyase family enzyme